MILNISKEVDRPLIELNDIFEGCTALLDTGALIPIWTKSEKLLVELGATLIKKKVSFNGFGGDAVGSLYRLDFRLGDYYYPNMPIVATVDDTIPGYFLLSATMFLDMDIAIRNSNKTIEIEAFTNQKCFNITIDNQVLVQ